jgi:hypothetical protein
MFAPPPKPPSAIGRLYELLVETARAGRQCPTNEIICQACDISSLESASRALRTLAVQGHISVYAASNRRVVRITALGIATKNNAAARPGARNTRPGPRNEGSVSPMPTSPESHAANGHAARAVAPVDLLNAAAQEASRRGETLTPFLARILWMGWETYNQQKAAA